MINRRSLLLGAAAVAVAPASATALPARVLDLVPCDGRVLPICDYLGLFNVLRDAYGSTHGLHNAFAFRVPDYRARIWSDSDPDVNRVLPVDVVIVARPGMGLPVGTITHMARPLTVEQALRAISAEAHELNRRHRLHVRGMLHG